MHFVRLGLLALAPACLFAAEKPIEPPYRLAVASSNGFCANGVYAGTKWPSGVAPKSPLVWGSFCRQGNDDVGRFESETFLAPKALDLNLAGYPGKSGRRLLLRNMQTGAEAEIKPAVAPGEIWRYYRLGVPGGWSGQQVRLVAVDDATGPFGWLGFTLPDVPPDSLPGLPKLVTSGPPGGFCSDGFYGSTRWPGNGRPAGTLTWGSFCGKSDGDTGWFASPELKAGPAIQMYLAGYPDAPGLGIRLENVTTGVQFPLPVLTAPGETWTLYKFRLPSGWNRQRVRVIARDDATGVGGWLAFSEPVAAEFESEPLTMQSLLWLGAILLGPVLAALLLARLWKSSDWQIQAAAALLVFAATVWLCFHELYWRPFASPMAACGGFAAAALAIGYVARRSGSLTPFTASDRRKWALVGLIWGVAAVAILPVIFEWTAPQPDSSIRYFLVAAGYAVAAGICYAIFRAERRRLPVRLTIALVFLILLLTAVANNLHSFNVDQSDNYVPAGNRVWQAEIHEQVIQLRPDAIPHSYRFLPNSIVRWMEMARLDFVTSRDLYRLLAGILLFYAIYRYARLYCNFNGAILAMLFSAVIYPVSFEYYAGQLTDPLAHLSFVLALICLETEEFALLVTTLVIGSLAKETVLALAGYYILFHRKERYYPAKAVTLALSSAAVYLGVRVFVLHGMMSYQNASAVTPDHIAKNWDRDGWPLVTMLTGGALLPFLALGWRQTAVALKRQVFFLLPVLFISSLLFSWLNESRNYMPLVFVLSVVAGGYLSRSTGEQQAVDPEEASEAVSITGQNTR